MPSKNRIITLSLGESISNKNGELDLDAMRSISRQFQNLTENGYKIIAIVGAGGLGRYYREVARKFTKTKETLDRISIESSRVNADLLIDVLRAQCILVKTTPLNMKNEFKENLENGWNVLVSGSLESGKSSLSTAAELAFEIRSDYLLIVSTDGGIYEENKSQNSHRIIRRVDSTYLRRLLSSNAGHILDRQTCNLLLAERKRLEKLRVFVTDFKTISRIIEKSGDVGKQASWTEIVN